MEQTQQRWMWYERPGVVIAAIVLFWPLGIALMWAQRKFTSEIRIAVTVGVVVLTLIGGAGVLAARMSAEPPAGETVVESAVAPGSVAPSTAASASAATTPTPSGTPTGSVAATSAGKPVASSAPNKPAPSGQPVQQPSSQPVPGAPVAPTPAGDQRFTMNGTYRSSSSGTTYVAFSLKAAPADGAVKYQWWVHTPDSSTSYLGQNVSAGYYGVVPTSIVLVTYDAEGAAKSSTAEVEDFGGQLTAAGK